jgi:hypothetical protein
MEAHEILKKAWDAVKAADLPESMQEAAFREAVALIRDEHGSATDGGGGPPSNRSTSRRAPATPIRGNRQAAIADDAESQSASTPPDEATFFAKLSHESGVSETDLRDILSLGSSGEVHVTPPTRVLGASRADQARTVTSLIVAARAIGLGEAPIDADAVRKEVDRKHAYDSGNYGSTVVGRLAGVNYGGDRGKLVLTSKWVGEFVAAVNRAHERSSDSGEE